MRRILGLTLVAGLAFLLAAGAPLVASDDGEPAAQGRVTAFEAGQSIFVESGGAQKEFKLTPDTKVEGECAVGKEVEVWAKDGTATRIVVKP